MGGLSLYFFLVFSLCSISRTNAKAPFDSTVVFASLRRVRRGLLLPQGTVFAAHKKRYSYCTQEEEDAWDTLS